METPASLLMSSGTYAYEAVKASIHAAESAVFGLNEAETVALVKHFNNYKSDVINGIVLKATPIQVVNALGQLGYRVIGTTGDSEIVWTMQRDI